MFSSEQTFTINGDDDNMLQKVLELALECCGWKGEINAFYEDINGLVFCPYKSKYDKDDVFEYPFKPTIPVIVEQIKQYINNLSTDEIIRLAGLEPCIDGTVNLGWELFHPLWFGPNEIENYKQSAILAVRPCWIIYAK